MNKIILTYHEIANCTGAHWVNLNSKKLNKGVRIVWDSREVKRGCLFWPLVGKNFDAHQFLPQVLKAGCAAVVVNFSNKQNLDVPYLPVANVNIAFQNLATYVAHKSKAIRIGITGSNGKTSTKEMARLVLSQVGNVHATAKNNNNEFGVAYTLLGIQAKHQFAVLEMGTSGVGEIEILTQMVQPHFAIITMVGASHLQGLNSLADVYQEKRSIEKGLVDQGKLIVNGDDKYLKKIKSNKKRQIITFGLSHTAVCPSELSYHKGCARFKIGNTPFILNVPGEHNLKNALAVIALGLELGIPKKHIAKGLSLYKGVKGRLIRKKIKDKIILDDTYNANPQSMKAALEVLKEITSPGCRVAILGDMLELGSQSDHYHEELGKYILDCKIDRFLAFGKQIEHTYHWVKNNGFEASKCFYTANPNKALIWLNKNTFPKDILLFKGSRGIKVEQLIEGFTRES